MALAIKRQLAKISMEKAWRQLKKSINESGDNGGDGAAESGGEKHGYAAHHRKILMWRGSVR